MGMAYFLDTLSSLGARWRPWAWIAVLLCVVTVGWIGYADRSVWDLVEYAGLLDQLEQVAAQLEPNAVLLFDDSPVVGVGSTIGTPLQFLFGFTVFDLQEDLLDAVDLATAVSTWQDAGRAVYWVEGPSPSLGLPNNMALTAHWGPIVVYPQLEGSYNKFPERREIRNVPLEFYRFLTDGAALTCESPYVVDVGTLDIHAIQEGFYGKDAVGDRSVRWTGEEALLKLPCIPTTDSRTLRLVLEVAGLRPVELSPASLEVYVGGVLVGRFSVANDFQEVQMDLPGSVLEEEGGHVRLVSDIWIPAEHGVGSDGRDLGVLLDTIVVSSLESPHD